MDKSLDPLILDLIEWIAREPRSYPELIDAWRTSCPRLTVWEDALERGFVTREGRALSQTMIHATAAGREFLRAHGRACSCQSRARASSMPESRARR